MEHNKKNKTVEKAVALVAAGLPETAGGVETRSSTPAPQARVLLERVDLRHAGGNTSVVAMSAGSDGGATSDGSLVTVSSGSSVVPSRLWQRRKRQRSVAGLSESSGEETAPKPRVRGRGRPPTTGEYVGLAQAKKELNAQKREELRLQYEEELAGKSEEFRKTRKVQLVEPVAEGELRSKTAEELRIQVDNEVALINTIACKSNNLKSQYVRDLRVAASSIKEAMRAASSRTPDEEERCQRSRGDRLQAELSSVREELKSLKEEMAKMRSRHPEPSVAKEAERGAVPSSSASGAPTLEEICGAVTGMVGKMLDARLAGIEDRLLPGKIHRPPLASDKRATEPGIRPREAAQAAPSNPKDPGEKKKAKRAKKGDPEPIFVPAPQPPPPTEAWNVVTRKGAKKAKGPDQAQQTRLPSQTQQASQTQQPPKPRAQPPPQSQQQQQRQWQRSGAKEAKAKARRKRVRKLRTPRSAAVVITLQPEAEAKGATYAQVLAEAKCRVSLAELGIPSLRIKKTATGARLMEVAGANNAERADSLAAKLRECLGEAARVHRPVKTAEMRVSGLDDSVTVAEVNAAFAQVGGCPADQVQAGTITVGANGLGSVWLRAPVAAARKVVDGGRLLVGWVSAQVKLLEARNQRCFRCLEGGHVRAQCKSEVDRTDECYRCGKAGHKARGCEAPPHCTFCSAAGKPAEHCAGDKACAPPPKTKRGSRGGRRAAKQSSRPSAPTRARTEADQEMEAD